MNAAQCTVIVKLAYHTSQPYMERHFNLSWNDFWLAICDRSNYSTRVFILQ